MKNKLLAETIKTVNIEKIVSDTIKAGVPTLVESYVAEPKKYSQVSEKVSQKTKDGHEALYKGYVSCLNKVSNELDTAKRSIDDVNASHCDFRSLKLDETYNLNAKWLHELYFANCFDPHSELYMNSKSYIRFQRDFGTFEDWQRDMMACAVSSGCGWAVCAYNIHLQRYVNTFISNHSQDVMLGLYPIIVIDMWEHAYARDYNTDKRSYLVAMMKEINWQVIEERVNKAERIAEVLK